MRSWRSGSSRSGWPRGCCPRVHEYAARFGLTTERLSLAAPGCLVMHPGPMNEGVEIAPDVANGPRSLITEQVANGVPVRMAVLALCTGVAGRMSATATRAVRGEVGEHASLELTAWALDPVAGRSGPARLVVRDGILESIAWLDDAPGRRRSRRHRGTRLPRPPRASSRARQRGRGDRRQRARGGGPRRVHRGVRDAQHDAADRQRGGGPGDPRAPRPRPARPSGCCRSAPPPRVGRGSASRRSASSSTPAPSAFSDDGAPIQATELFRNALAYAGMLGVPADRPSRGSGADGRRRGARRPRRDRARAARLARRPPRPTPSPATSPSSRRSSATSRPPGCT